jgi:hypothetical protein
MFAHDASKSVDPTPDLAMWEDTDPVAVGDPGKTTAEGPANRPPRGPVALSRAVTT